MKLPTSKLVKKQTIKHETEGFRIDGGHGRLVVTIRYDDQCGNGHNTFSITGDITRDGRDWSGGCIHDDIIKYMPELEPLIKWHLCDSDQPMHYTANPMYHASDKDCWGLRKGEKKQIRNGRTGKLSWKLENEDDLPSHVDSDDRPEATTTRKYVPWCRVGEGKEPNLEAARSCAIWPDATLEQLQDEDALNARLPALMEAFKAMIESQGMEY